MTLRELLADPTRWTKGASARTADGTETGVPNTTHADVLALLEEIDA